MIKIPANISFKIGIIDAWGNQQYVDFPANQTTYGLVRNGEWGQATIPVEDIRGELIDLRMLSYEFVILEVNGASCEFALDDIYWEGGVMSTDHHSNNFDIKYFPNPVTNIINLSLPKGENEVFVYSQTGMLLTNFTVLEEDFSYDMKHFKTGIYVFKVLNDNKSKVFKVIKSFSN